ncbi:mannitol dehydrogenase family protein [Lichenicoccus roseus]|uniref:Mannitol dehydrogenase family protein n=1 Tax=Lichenicoccus roseus TaxID=2683649 RepID=A0A5R9JD35_9PROT|nr:mannitol dehydrogenase family protein [Lichenicoccus roseus]TLU73306.1 mannitol dehydrogenase family protein [Lichenicoccus roseus]
MADSNLLATLPAGIARPAYDRSRVRAGIAHLGVGNFHRSHQAFYLDRLLADASQNGWGILGIGIQDTHPERDKALALQAQDGLYTLTICPPDAAAETVLIGALVEYMHLPNDPEAVLRRLAEPAIRIVSLTITEGGYNLDEHGGFRLEQPDVAADLAAAGTGTAPRTVFGLVVEALHRRRTSDTGPFTVLSCDNLMHNGQAARAAFVGFARARDPGLADWIETEVSFPNSMVDGIAPFVSADDAARLNDRSGAADRAPVFREDFTQWVLEDRFCAGRPPLEQVGAQFTDKVDPYELVKLRMLNAGHTVMALPSILLGHQLVHEAMQDELVSRLVERYLSEDAAPHLTAPPGMATADYAALLLRRFRNPNIRDQVSRIAGQSSAKLPVFLRPTAEAVLASGGDHRRIAFIAAAFVEYLRGQDDFGRSFPVAEPALTVPDLALAARHDLTDFLRMSPFAGWSLERYPDFIAEVGRQRSAIRAQGTRAALQALLQP